MKMGITLIIIGIISIASGIGILIKNNKLDEKNSLSNEKTIIDNTNIDNNSIVKESDSQQKGFEFEKYVISLFPKKYYSIKEWRSDKYSNGRYAESNTYPDLLLSLNLGKEESVFAVECKWRNGFNQNDYLQWCDKDQRERYVKFEKETGTQVFIILGVGGTPNNPENIYCIPLNFMKFNTVKKDYLTDFKHTKGTNFYYDKESEILN